MQSRKPEQRDLDYAKAVLELYDVRAAESARRARAGMFQRVGAPAQVIFVMEWLSWADFNRWLQATFDLPREIEMGVDRRTLVRAIDANGTKNPPPNRAVEQRLKEENSLDAELYRWALERMRSTIEAWKNEGVPKKEFQKNRVPRAALKKPPSPPQVSRKRNRPSTKPRPPLAVPNTAPDTPKAPFRKPQRSPHWTPPKPPPKPKPH
jgi:hypothetical protein